MYIKWVYRRQFQSEIFERLTRKHRHTVRDSWKAHKATRIKDVPISLSSMFQTLYGYVAACPRLRTKIGELFFIKIFNEKDNRLSRCRQCRVASRMQIKWAQSTSHSSLRVHSLLKTFYFFVFGGCARSSLVINVN